MVWCLPCPLDAQKRRKDEAQHPRTEGYENRIHIYTGCHTSCYVPTHCIDGCGPCDQSNEGQLSATPTHTTKA